MAAFAKSITPSLATKLPCNAHRTWPSVAGEDIAAGDACYLKAADGLYYRSSGAAVAEAARVDGYAAIDHKQGSPVQLFHGVHLAYGAANSTPGTNLYLSGTVAGGLDTAASTGGTDWVARVDAVTTLEGTNHAVLYVRKSTY